ncbi:hypothetical protein [Halovulum marinum]|uniref:hypothetical protein n=1 Tax=Halovulum marinum TaxID=2662447 RepID=UPI0012B24CA5|nr:hypothetical protein [Halovulum marinum]
MDNMHDAGWLIARGRCLSATEQLAQKISECRKVSIEVAREEAIAYAASVTMEKIYLYRLARTN